MRSAREAQRVADRPGGDLVVAHEPRQDRQAGGVRRRPAVGAQVVGAQIPDGARARLPAVAAPARVEQLVEAAGVLVDKEDVAVAARLLVRMLRDRIADAIGLVRVLERHLHLGGALPGDDGVRDAVAEVRPEVGVHRVVGADRADHRRRVRRHGQVLDGLFQTFDDGKMGHARAPGTVGPRPPAAADVPAASTQAARIASPRRRMRLTVPARTGTSRPCTGPPMH